MIASAICPILYQVLLWARNHHDTLLLFHRRNNINHNDDDNLEGRRGRRRNADNDNGANRKYQLAIERRKMVFQTLIHTIAYIVPPLELYNYLTYIIQHQQRRREDIKGGGGKNSSSLNLALYWSGLDMVRRSVRRAAVITSRDSNDFNTSTAAPAISGPSLSDHTDGSTVPPPPTVICNNNTSRSTTGIPNNNLDSYPTTTTTTDNNNQHHTCYDYSHRRNIVEEAITTAGMVVPINSWRMISDSVGRSWSRRRIR